MSFIIKKMIKPIRMYHDFDGVCNYTKTCNRNQAQPRYVHIDIIMYTLCGYSYLIIVYSVAVSKSAILTPSSQPVTYMNISTKTLDTFSSSTSRNISRSQDDSIDVMPASVEDHFAKALGDQWSKLNTNSNVSPQSTVIS